MHKYGYDPHAYEERYRRVYEAGAEFWEEPIATEALVKFIQEFNLPAGLMVVDLGCGEGRDSIFLSKTGFHVIGIDVSPSAVKRAKKWARREGALLDFLVADVAELPIRSEVYDLAVNVACLHMIIDQNVRNHHLREAFRVLKSGGIYFSCNLGVDEPVSVEEFRKKPGGFVSRKVKVEGKEKEILLPIIPAWPKTREQYLDEFTQAGFKILKVYREETKPIGSCWILVAKK